MKKKIFGIKISTLLTAFACIIVAFLIWMLVKYRTDLNAADSAIGVFCRNNMRLK